FSRGLAEGLAQQGRVILGGDISFILIQREASAAELAFIRTLGRTSTIATMRSMARNAAGDATLVEVKAVDGAYPLYGAVAAEPTGDIAGLLEKRGAVFGAIAGPILLARLNVQPGGRLTVGDATLEVRAGMNGEPDK